MPLNPSHTSALAEAPRSYNRGGMFMQASNQSQRSYVFAVPKGWCAIDGTVERMFLYVPYVWRDGEVLSAQSDAFPWTESMLVDQAWSSHTAEGLMGGQVALDWEGKEGQCLLCVSRKLWETIEELGLSQPPATSCCAQFPNLKVFILEWEQGIEPVIRAWHREAFALFKDEIGKPNPSFERALKAESVVSSPTLCGYHEEPFSSSSRCYRLIVEYLRDREGEQYQRLLAILESSLDKSTEELEDMVQSFIRSCRG